VAQADFVYPPGPSSVQSLKIIRELVDNPLETLLKIANKYGEVSHFKVGSRHVFLINNPEYIEKILIYNHQNFKKGKRLQTAKKLLGEGLVTSEDKKHESQRKIIQPLFLPKKITSYGQIMVDECKSMCKEWGDDSVVDIHKEMMKVTLRIICKSILDYDLNSDEAQQFTKALEISKKYFKRLQHPLGNILDHVPILPKVMESRQAIKTIDSLVYRLIKDKKMILQSDSAEISTKKGEDDLLSRLLQNQRTSYSKNHNEEGKGVALDDNVAKETSMNDQQIRDNVVTMLIAGHETTANALTWTYYLVSQNPQVEKKMTDEIDLVLLRDVENKKATIKTPSIKDLPKLKYVEKVLRESLRMYPPVWSIGRIVESDYLVGEYTIPKGSSIVMSQYVMHHDDRFYNNPTEFNPDRWTDEFKRSLPRFSYFPFGGGIRGCIGEPFSWQEGILLIATISSNWTVSIVPKQKVKLDPGITLNPKNGIKMRLSSRKRIG
jgi:cytochrome P450